MAVKALAVAFFLVLRAAAGGDTGDAGAAQNSNEPRPPAPEPEPEPEKAPPQLEPPVPVGDLSVPLPPDAPPLVHTVLVSVTITVDDHGEVTAVRLDHGAGPPWDEAVMVAATRFAFQPARLGGVAVGVEVPFVARFVPPPKPPEAEGPPKVAVLEGHLVEKGTLRPVPAVGIAVELGGHSYGARTSPDGAFHLDLPEGLGVVTISAPGYRDFQVAEILRPHQAVQVRYLIERVRYNPFETIVVGSMDRVEVSRIELRGRELTHVPGAFGDPFRAVGTLPGVGNIFSLLGYTVVRGTSPGNTGTLVDGIPIPQLFHFFAGPAVMHPAFIDRVDFYPGGFPVRYGGFTGGIIDGLTAPPESAQGNYVMPSFSLLTTGLLVYAGKPQSEQVTVAGRYGYPSLLLSAIGSGTTASYGDYQLRYDDKGGRFTAFVYGSDDRVNVAPDGVATTGDSTDVSGLVSDFHRLTARYRLGDHDQPTMLETTFGYDEIGASRTYLRNLGVYPRVSTVRILSPELRLRTGFDASYRRAQGFVLDAQAVQLAPPNDILTMGGWADLPWSPAEGLIVTPGVRVDVYASHDIPQPTPGQTTTAPEGPLFVKASVDPRLLWRLRLSSAPGAETWLKGSAGLYSQPPRSPLPLPGVSELGLSSGLIHSYQGSLGAERNLGAGFSLDAQGYFNWMDPVFYDLTLNQSNSSIFGGSASQISDLVEHRVGRAYGLELLLRRRDQNGLFGWISYTLSRSERRWGSVWKAYDFDRTHMLQVVVGTQLPRNWELGAHVLLQSGRPANGPYDLLTRVDPFWRFDIRVDKRAVFNGWLLDFYAEIINSGVTSEELSAGAPPVPYAFPNFGFQGVIPY